MGICTLCQEVSPFIVALICIVESLQIVIRLITGSKVIRHLHHSRPTWAPSCCQQLLIRSCRSFWDTLVLRLLLPVLPLLFHLILRKLVKHILPLLPNPLNIQQLQLLWLVVDICFHILSPEVHCGLHTSLHILLFNGFLFKLLALIKLLLLKLLLFLLSCMLPDNLR